METNLKKVLNTTGNRAIAHQQKPDTDNLSKHNRITIYCFEYRSSGVIVVYVPREIGGRVIYDLMKGPFSGPNVYRTGETMNARTLWQHIEQKRQYAVEMVVSDEFDQIELHDSKGKRVYSMQWDTFITHPKLHP